jgi:hypothetical protein
VTWIVSYDIGPSSGHLEFDYEDDAYECYDDLCEQAEYEDEAMIEIREV